MSTSAPVAPRKFRAGLVVWSVLWAVLAVVHVTQAIWFSGGAACPGDLGDGRFNELVLEHGYQSLRGVYHWSSPGQFYPAADTLGYSDTHLGTLPIYAAARSMGLPIEQAWQTWFVVVAALNAVAGFRLFGALGVMDYLRGPLVFAAVASSTMVWLTGTHMQMLPMFPLLLAWAELLRWCRDRRRLRLAAATGWFSWQFAAGPYLAFFGAAITLAIGGIRWIAARASGERLPSPENPTRPHRWSRVWAIFVGLAGCILGAAVGWVYVQALSHGAGRSMIEVSAFAPEPSSWLRPNHLSLFYNYRLPVLATFPVEETWFAGVLPWLAVAIALGVGIRGWRNPDGAWLAAIAGGVLLIVLFFTQWSDAHPGAWYVAAKYFPPLRAFRAAGRIAGVLQVAMIVVAGLLLARWSSMRTPRCRLVAIGGACLFALEALSHHQPAMSVTVARARSDAMLAAWHLAGDRPVLAYAPGITNQPSVWSNLDAWNAALRVKRVTIDGYSGGVPPSHLTFFWHPTAENARTLLATLAIPPDRVSLVERLSAPDEARLGFQHYAAEPVQSLAECQLQPFAWKLFAPLEQWRIDDVTMYQFTPAAEVRFHLPDAATRIEYLVGFRPDAYTNGGKTDGAGVTWLVASPGQPEHRLSYELLTPLTNPAHRGLLPRTLAIPPGHDRELILRTDTGPAHSLLWDLLLFGRIRAE